MCIVENVYWETIKLFEIEIELGIIGEIFSASGKRSYIFIWDPCTNSIYHVTQIASYSYIPAKIKLFLKPLKPNQIL